MRYIQALLIALCCVALVGCIEDPNPTYEQTTRVKIGDLAPDFTTVTIDNQHITLSELRGKIVLLTLFSSSCPDCHDQFEYIGSKITSFDESKFIFLPISRGEQAAVTEKFRRENGYTFDIGLDPDRAIYDLYATQYVPRNYLIGRDGRVIALSAEPTHAQLDVLLAQIAELTK
ncbi:MAG: TlpA family protein disulfide reductase [Rikenellaceae bacterium]|nr:TlpA family protein disulfide reductase [Rikenellaceae bacterium]